MTDIHNLHYKLSEATAELTQIRERRTTLEAELATLTPLETELSNRATSLTAELQRLEPPAPRPQDVERLARLTEALRSKLSEADRRSPTVQRVRASLERLTDESVTVSDRLSLALSLLDDLKNHYQLDRRLWDKAEGHNAAQRGR